MTNTANAVTNQIGQLLSGDGLDLYNLKAAASGSKPDVWTIEINKHREATLAELIAGPLNATNAPFSLLASVILREEKGINSTTKVQFARNGYTKEIVTEKARYRGRASKIYTKLKKQGKKSK